jgi:VWFA-related protein
MILSRTHVALVLAVFSIPLFFWAQGSLARQQAPSLQQPTGPSANQQATDPQARIRATTELVVVPVTVKNARGALVGDLRQEEFRVFEDSVEQRISQFSAEATPLSAVLLVDDDLTTKTADQVQKSLVAMAGGFSADDEVAVARFDAFYTPVMDFSNDNDKLITELQRMRLDSSFPGAGSDPLTSGPMINNHPAPGSPIPTQATRGLPTKRIDDAIHAAAEALRTRDRERRKVIILVSDGINAKNNTYSRDDTLKLLLSNGVSVYALGVDAAILNRLKSVLESYAHATGGDAYYASKSSALEDLYSQVCEQARLQYTLSYAPSGTDRTANYHSIEVRVRRPGLNLLTRDGYYLAGTP